MNNTVELLCLCVMIIKCTWYFHNVYAIQVPISLNYKGKYSSDVKNFEIIFPQRVNKDGNFISHLVQHRHSKRSTNEVQYIFYKIPIKGKDYLIELTPNRKLIAPGAVVEIRKADTSSKRKFFNENSQNDTIREIFENLEIKKLENTECHFSGHVKGENISNAALSTCHGLAGFIQIKQGFYTIEPVAGHNSFLEDSYPHILYKEDGLENLSTCHTIRQMATSLLDKVVRKRRESFIKSSAPMFAETLIVMDKTMINHHRGADCENYALTVFNMAFNLFRDASVGMLMTLTVVRIIRLEAEDDQMNLKLDQNAMKTLKYFQTWQYEINPGDDTHPNHHDIALLLTRVNVCYSPTSCDILGLTTIGKACDPRESAALCEDNGLRLGYVIAHEIGHLLGADHDTANRTCNGTSENGLRTVMHPHVSMASKTWSECSQASFRQFFKTVENCFLDEPEEHHFNVQDLLPGVMYGANFQCKYVITRHSRECDMGSTCTSLNCHVPGYACIVTHIAPADGTRCGEGMWCHNSRCLAIGERPGAVDGNWGEWSSWSDCSRTCGSGVTSSTRNCDRPQPAHGGKNCVGERRRYKICATTPQNISDLIRFISEEVNVSFVGKPCETGRPSFRDMQCGEFNDWIYPEDGKTHFWKAYYIHEGNPCVLYCINENNSVAALKPRVVDGTTCYRGIRDLCVAGTCKSLPCDLRFGSNAVEDVCGVCHGDGTGCEFSQGVGTFKKVPDGATKLVNIPVGTKNIRVEETLPSLAKIVVTDKDTRDVYVRGKNLGIFNVPGSEAWLGMLKKNQEALYISGPVSKPLTVWIERLENVTVKWSMALPAEQQRKPEFAWDFLKWSPCSAECGPGVQKSDPSCTEGKAGLVEDTFCADLQIPPTKVRPCEIAKCIPRWMVGDWKYCEKSESQRKERKRVVYCIKKIGEGEGEMEIVPDSECKDPKPHSVEPCEHRKKREDTEYNYLDNKSTHLLPQERSQTRPLVSSHSRRYYQALETPKYWNADLVKLDYLNINSIGNITHRIRDKISSKDTFSGDQNGVVFSQLNTFSKRKSVKFENPTGMKKRTTAEVMLGKLKGQKSKGRSLNRGSNFSHRSSRTQTGFSILKKNHVTVNSNANGWETPLLSKKYPFLKLRANLGKTLRKKRRKPSNWKNKSPRNFNASLRESNWKLPNTEKKLNLLRGQNRIRKKSKRHNKIFLPNRFNKYPNFKEKRISEKYSKRNSQSEKRNLYSSSGYRKLNKAKRSNRKWKKPKVKDAFVKSTKDYVNDNERRKYLNNLFRENRKKTVVHKTVKIVSTNEPPVIQVGKVVIDRDSVEDKHMEILFLRNKVEENQEPNTQLPRPPVNVNKVTLKGQDVFDLIQRFQRCSCLYRRGHGKNEKPTLDINIRIPETSSEDQKTVAVTKATKTGRDTSTYAMSTRTESTIQQTTTQSTTRQTTTTTTTQSTTLTTQAQTTSESSKASTATTSTTATTPISTNRTQTSTIKEQTSSTSPVESKTTTEKPTCKNDTVVEEIGIENSKDENEYYDIDEIIPYPPGVEVTTEELQKKKKKPKKGKYKGPYLEDYE